MVAIIFAVVLGTATAVAFVALAVDAFRRLRVEIAAADTGLGSVPPASGDVDASEREGFPLKAAGGVVASTLMLVLISASPVAWYVTPFLAIGSSIAVVVAFLLERDGSRRER